MTKKMSLKEFADKVVWEGGLSEAILGYGLGPENILDVNEETTRLKEAIQKFTEAGEIIEEILGPYYDEEDF